MTAIILPRSRKTINTKMLLTFGDKRRTDRIAKDLLDIAESAATGNKLSKEEIKLFGRHKKEQDDFVAEMLQKYTDVNQTTLDSIDYLDAFYAFNELYRESTEIPVPLETPATSVSESTQA